MRATFVARRPRSCSPPRSRATISAGALLGGVVVDSISTPAVLVFGGVVALLMVVTVLYQA